MELFLFLLILVFIYLVLASGWNFMIKPYALKFRADLHKIDYAKREILYYVVTLPSAFMLCMAGYFVVNDTYVPQFILLFWVLTISLVSAEFFLGDW